MFSSEVIEVTDEANTEEIPKKSIFSSIPTLKPSTGDLEFVLEDEPESKQLKPAKTPKPVANFIKVLLCYDHFYLKSSVNSRFLFYYFFILHLNLYMLVKWFRIIVYE